MRKIREDAITDISEADLRRDLRAKIKEAHDRLLVLEWLIDQWQQAGVTRADAIHEMIKTWDEIKTERSGE